MGRATARGIPAGQGDASGARGRSRAERYRAGRELRRQVRRSAQADWSPARDRADPIDLLRAADGGRVPALLPIRYARMASSPFAFLRGAAVVMARDLSTTRTTGLAVQLVGDAHPGNFGLFATPERDQVFDANDFDETTPGPWEWDVKRLASGLVLVARANRLSGKLGRAAARAAARAYRHRLEALAGMRYLDAWYAHLDLAGAAQEVGAIARRWLRRELPVARLRTGFHAFPRLARRTGAHVRIRDDPPLLRHFDRSGDEAAAREVFRSYRENLADDRRVLLDRYRLVDVAQKVVGVGSVGTRCSIGLFLADPDLEEPLFLQVKEARASVYERYLGRSPYRSHAERVVVGQRLVQEASDLFLGWGRAGPHDFYVRQLRDMKFASDLSSLGPRALLGLAELCGASLARAHARTGDAAAIAGYLGRGEGFDEAMVRFGEGYAHQTEEDHAVLLKAIATGRLPAAPAG